MPRDEDSSYNYINFTELARLLAQAAVASPAVAQAPANTAPSAPEVKQVVAEVASVVAPIIAPSVPKQAIGRLADEVVTQVVSNPAVVKADTNVAIPTKVVDKIATAVADSDSMKAANAQALAAVTNKAPATVDDRAQAIAEYRDFFGIQPTPKVEEPVVQPFTENTSVSEPDISKIMEQAANAAAEEPVVPAPVASQITKSIDAMTKEEIDAFTKAVIAAGGKSTDPANRLPGESASEANARITAGYKELLAKPVLSEDATNAGAEVRFVRTGPGGQGEYTVVTPMGYTGPNIVTTNWTEGIIPATGKYTTGTTLGVMSQGNGTYVPVASVSDIVNQGGGVSGATYTPKPITPTTPTGPSGITAPTGPAFTATGPAVAPTGPSVPNIPGITGATLPIGPTGAAVQTYTAPDGTKFTDASAYVNYVNMLQTGQQARQSAYDLLLNEFKKYGLESLVEDIKGLIQSNISPSQFAIELQNTDAYKKRFAANQDRIKQGLRALTPAEYIGLEDQYQNIMRNYGLPASYYSKDSMGTQAGFNKFIAGDVSAAELEDRIATAQKRVINADPNVTDALRRFYPDITNADILSYTLDPTNALENIKRKVTAAEIGGAALAQGLATGVGRAEELAKYGITKAQAQQGFQAIGEFLPTAEKLGDIYAKQGMGPYDQLTAEQEVFGTQGAAGAATKRKKLSQLEQAAFGAQSGLAQGALARDRAGAF